ncbi:MAG: transposase [Puniceicoccales bacterium]|nr:transposase [Puniceicoccales bacterium]
MIDTVHLKVHLVRPACEKGGFAVLRTYKGGLNSKLHAVCDGDGHPVRLPLTAGNINDIKGAAKLLEDLPAAEFVLADKGYDADWFRRELLQHDVMPCIPSRCNRKIQIPYDVTLYRRCHSSAD